MRGLPRVSLLSRSSFLSNNIRTNIGVFFRPESGRATSHATPAILRFQARFTRFFWAKSTNKQTEWDTFSLRYIFIIGWNAIFVFSKILSVIWQNLLFVLAIYAAKSHILGQVVPICEKTTRCTLLLLEKLFTRRRSSVCTNKKPPPKGVVLIRQLQAQQILLLCLFL